ncbi:nitrogen regulation protein NR(II) [Geothrix sp. PMB-07]|uniref:two-component system sensor histidine kinase NtrB n=1 Tax=Geothrix sp. PMB-07 TaxID=3068640 RepID=UPI0027428B25|nr:ATP-binding protein [Geothrix sp. PMB-07]WLT30246.1 ATP-binding protein [Geothrix sp. PMB-07]
MGPRGMSGNSIDRLSQAVLPERALMAALDQAFEAIALLDAKDGTIVHSNAAFARTFGDSSQKAPRQRLLDLFQLDEAGQVLTTALQQARSGQTWMGCTPLKTLTGKAIHFEVALSPVRGDDDAVRSLVVRLRDLTLDVETNRHLRLAQKMNSLGVLAGGVAHDFNNLIGAILNTAEQIEMQVEPDSPVRRKLETIQRIGDRAKGLTSQILNFSGHSEGKWSLIDLSDLIIEVTNVLKTTFPENVKVRTDLTKGTKIYGDPSQLHQVVLNLGINASQAMQPAGGILSIHLQPAVENHGTSQGSTEPCVLLTVEDSGCGMDSRTLERIFEPFFTTKEAGHGTGLGLSVVYDIVHAHGGSLQVSSKPGQGSSFQILLPLNHGKVKVWAS